MLDHQIVGFASAECFGYIFQPFFCKVDIYGVHDCGLFVQDHIGVVGHSVGNGILSFKEVYMVVVDTHIADCFCYCCHIVRSPFIYVHSL